MIFCYSRLIHKNFNILMFLFKKYHYCRKLHTICSYLIALDCLCLALFQLHPISTAFIFYSGIHFITAEACFWIQAIPTFCIHVQFGSMILIGLERLLNILFPIWLRILFLYIISSKFLCIKYSKIFRNQEWQTRKTEDIFLKPTLENLI